MQRMAGNQIIEMYQRRTKATKNWQTNKEAPKKKNKCRQTQCIENLKRREKKWMHELTLEQV
jgi:hypothetical protein